MDEFETPSEASAIDEDKETQEYLDRSVRSYREMGYGKVHGEIPPDIWLGWAEDAFRKGLRRGVSLTADPDSRKPDERKD
jgi:hypothetical protein